MATFIDCSVDKRSKWRYAKQPVDVLSALADELLVEARYATGGAGRIAVAARNTDGGRLPNCMLWDGACNGRYRLYSLILMQ